MTPRWPLALFSLLVIPLLAGLYVWALRRRRRNAVRFSNVSMVRAAIPKRTAWKRHIPVGVFLVGLASMGIATARPQASTLVPRSRTSVILAFDISRSMCSTDVTPNRLAAAQDAARDFIRNQPSGTRVGIVAFAGFAQLVAEPTTDKTELLKTIDSLTTSRGTAIGAAILRSIDALATINPDVTPSDATAEADANGATFDPFDDRNGEITPSTATPRKEGHVADIVVLLTDGANTVGVRPLVAADQAVTRGVRVYTIGFGTNEEAPMVCTPEQAGGDVFGGGGFGGSGGPFGGGGRRRFLVIDEPTLREVATRTGAQFFKAEDAPQLKKVFADLPAQIELTKRDVELTAAFAAAGAFLVLLATALSLWWNRSG